MKKLFQLTVLLLILVGTLQAQTLQFKKDKEFKVVQFTDMHYKPGVAASDTVLQPVIDRQIPWAFVHGNHDDEHDWNRTQVMDYIMQKPYSMVQRGDKHLYGEGNYIIEVRASDNADDISTYIRLRGGEILFPVDFPETFQKDKE